MQKLHLYTSHLLWKLSLNQYLSRSDFPLPTACLKWRKKPKGNVSKESKVTTNQRAKKLGHIVLSKKGPCNLWPSAWQSRKGLRGRRNSTPFSVGGLLWLFSRLAFETLRTNSSFLWIQLTDGLRDPKSEETNSALWERWAGSVWNWTAALLPVAAAATTTPPSTLPSPPPPHSHCTCSAGHMLIQLVNMTVNAMIDGWSNRRLLQRAVALVLQ